MAINMNNVLAKAQRMILDENFNRDVERAASIQRGSKGGSDDFSAMEDALFGVSSGPSLAGYEKVAIPEDVRYSNNTDYSGVQLLRETPEQPRNMTNSKLPKAIVESFSKVPSPIEDAYSPATIETALQMAPKKAAPVREEVQPKAQYQPQVGGVDYNYLKYIINECIKENLKGRLNESSGGTLKGIKIGQGNVFEFMDSKGNIFEGQMKLKKRAK